jgi:hypothetical protein
LAQRGLERDDVADVVSFFGHHVNPNMKSMQALPAYDGQILGNLTTLPLDFDSPRQEPYRFLHTITSVMPGSLTPLTGLVGFADFLPVLARDMDANRPAYAAYAKTRMERSPPAVRG